MAGNESSNNNFRCREKSRGSLRSPRGRGSRPYSHSGMSLLPNPSLPSHTTDPGNAVPPTHFLHAFNEAWGTEKDKVLLTAVAHGTMEEVQVILDSCGGKNCHIMSITFHKALVSAAARGFKFAVQSLVNLGASPNFQNGWGSTALMAASENGHIEIMKYLLKKGSNSNMTNNFGDTPLLLCLRPCGSADMVRLLLEHGALCNKTNSKGISPLMKATEMRDVDSMKVLVTAGANKAGKCDSEGLSATSYAKSVGLRDVFNLLGPTKGKKKSYAANTSTALLEAVRKRKENAVRILLDCENSEVNTVCSSITPLSEILKDFSKSKSGSKGTVEFRILKLLLENGADVNKSAHWQEDLPLVVMTQAGNYEGVKLLIKYGADVNCRGKDDLSPLVIASRDGRNDLVHLLLDNKASTSYFRFDINPVTLALTSGHINTAKILLQRGTKVPDFGEALQKLVRGKQVEAIQFLVEEFKLDVNEYNVLHHAVRFGSPEVVDFLCTKIDPPADVNKTDHEGFTPAYLTYDIGILEKLIERGANICHKHDFSGDLLINAVKDVKEELVSYLISTGKVCLDNVDARGWSALTHVCINESFGTSGPLKIVELLLMAGADVNHQSLSGDTPLHFAASLRSHNLDMVKALLDAGADITAKNSFGETPFLKAAQTGNIELLQLLKDRGADMKESDNTGRTALMVALKHWSDSDDQLIPFLAEGDGIINAKTADGMTALMIAATSGDAANVKTLVELGADVTVIGEDSGKGRIFSVLSLILTECTTEINKNTIQILKLLVERGGLASLPPTPLFSFSFQRLVLFDQRELVKLMVTNGMGPELMDFPLYTVSTKGMVPLSPLLIAIMEGKAQIARFMIDSWFLISSDIFAMPNNYQLRHRLEDRNYKKCVDIINEMSAQVPSLMKLSFVCVSTALGSFPGREERVQQLPVPHVIQQKLLFRAEDVPMDMSDPSGDLDDKLSQDDLLYDDDDYMDDTEENWSYGSESSDIYLWRNASSAMDYFFDSDSNFFL